MLEEFGIFLILADKVSFYGITPKPLLTQLESLFAYHIEALVPSSAHASSASHMPQKLDESKNVQFFRVGTLHSRTLVICMKQKGVRSI